MSRRLLRDLVGIAAVVSPLALVLVLGSRGPATALLNFGPNDASYLASGFHPHHEVEGELATRWGGTSAAIALPLTVSGQATLALRSARVLPQAATTRVSLAGRQVGEFSSRGGRFELRRFDLGAPRREPLSLQLEVEGGGDPERGLKLDWLAIETGPEGRLWLSLGAALLVVALPLAVYVSCRAAGFGAVGAAGSSAPFTLALASAALWAPLGTAHVASKAGIVFILLALALGIGLRRVELGRQALVLILLGHAAHAGLACQPGFTYPDVQLFRRYVQELGEAKGGVAERGVAAQRATNTAYPRFVAGRPYAFPYSPLFFLPFTALEADEPIEDALRQVALLAVSGEVLLCFLLGRLALGARVGLAAALCAVLAPPSYSRVLYAMGATLTGHLFDLLAIAAAFAWSSCPAPRRAARVGLAQLVALGLYVSSLFNLGGFFCALVLLRRDSWRLLLSFALAAVVVVSALYHPFLRAFFGEIVPAVAAGAHMRAEADAGAGGPLAALARIPMFFGWGLPALALAGFMLMRRSAAHAARATFTAWLVAFGLLVALRAFGAGLFRDLKEITFVTPLVAILAGAALERIASRARGGRLAAALIALGLLAFCAERIDAYWTSYRPAYMSTAGAEPSPTDGPGSPPAPAR